MNKEQFYEHLELILRFLQETEQIRESQPVTETGSQRKQLADQFMSRYYYLYRLLRNNPNLRLDLKYKDFIAESQYLLKGLTFELNRYVNKLEDRLRTAFYDNEWAGIICPGRSAVEAVKEMYRGTAFEEFYEGDNPDALDLNTEDLDDDLESFSHKEGYLKENQIPREIPASHWWWWSPNEPPDYVREDDE